MNYLVLNTSVFVETRENGILLYDSKNGKKIVLNYNEEIAKFFSSKNYDMNVYPLYDEQYKKTYIKDLINSIIENGLGFISKNNKAPLQFSPILNIQNESVIEKENRDNTDNPLIHLRELTLYLDNDIFDPSNKHYTKQTICNFATKNRLLLDFFTLENFIKPLIASKSLFRLNIVANKLLNYPNIKKLLNMGYLIISRKALSLRDELSSRSNGI